MGQWEGEREGLSPLESLRARYSYQMSGSRLNNYVAVEQCLLAFPACLHAMAYAACTIFDGACVQLLRSFINLQFFASFVG